MNKIILLLGLCISILPMYVFFNMTNDNLFILLSITLLVVVNCVVLRYLKYLVIDTRITNSFVVKLSIVVPIVEEIIFRHGIFSLFQTKLHYDKMYNIIFTNILFGLLHGSNYIFIKNKLLIINQMCMTFLLGLICSYGNGIINACCIHIFYNSMMLSINYYFNKSNVELSGDELVTVINDNPPYRFMCYVTKRRRSHNDIYSFPKDYVYVNVSPNTYTKHNSMTNKINKLYKIKHQKNINL